MHRQRLSIETFGRWLYGQRFQHLMSHFLICSRRGRIWLPAPRMPQSPRLRPAAAARSLPRDFSFLDLDIIDWVLRGEVIKRSVQISAATQFVTLRAPVEGRGLRPATAIHQGTTAGGKIVSVPPCQRVQTDAVYRKIMYRWYRKITTKGVPGG